MTEVNNFPQLVEVARRLPDFPWETEFTELVKSHSNGPWPSDEEIEAAAETQSPEYMAQHSELLATARTLIRLPCENWAPESAKAWREEAVDKLQAVRQLSRAFARSSLLAEQQGDLLRAVEEAQYCFSLAVANRKGGLIVDYLVSAGIEGMGFDRLRNLRRKLPPEIQRSVIKILEAHEAAREPYDMIAARDAAWEVQHGADEEPDDSWIDNEYLPLTHEEREKIIAELEAERQRLAQMSPEEIAQERRDNYENADLRNLSLQRLLRIELAILAFQARQGSPPDLLEQLTPVYLTHVPRDPHGGGEFHYRRDGDEYELYGLNERLVDCGGKRGGIFSVNDGSADFFLDYVDYRDDFGGPKHSGFFARLLTGIRALWRSIVRF